METAADIDPKKQMVIASFQNFNNVKCLLQKLAIYSMKSIFSIVGI